MNTELRALADCYKIMVDALRGGDWVVDGDCDPYAAMKRAESVLEGHGWRWNKDTGWEAPK